MQEIYQVIWGRCFALFGSLLIPSLSLSLSLSLFLSPSLSLSLPLFFSLFIYYSACLVVSIRFVLIVDGGGLERTGEIIFAQSSRNHVVWVLLWRCCVKDDIWHHDSQRVVVMRLGGDVPLEHVLSDRRRWILGPLQSGDPFVVATDCRNLVHHQRYHRVLRQPLDSLGHSLRFQA